MKYWQHIKRENNLSQVALFDPDDDSSERIIQVSAERRNNDLIFKITEGCDEYFFKEFTRKEILEVIRELKQWIEDFREAPTND